ncbi:uncharacterized protein LOC134571358 [Pelobates fuscus]|uniref:uncharacterized protein LOC134571358 n=1 Tax=Pelobates fuscus TaxID=191477 RepID=UPI002FE498FC
MFMTLDVYSAIYMSGLLVGDIQGPQTWIDGEKITLYCTGSNCTPNTEVEWTVQDKDGNSVTISDIVTKDTEEEQPLMSAEYLINSEKKDKPGKKVCDFTSSLSFIPSLSRHLNSTVICEFTCAEKTEQKSFKYKSIYAKPQFIEPAEFTICNTEEVQLCINLHKFYPKHIDISWSCDHQEFPDIKNPECTMNYDGTYNTVIRQPVPADWFSDPNCKVCVTWRHVSMESPGCREFSVKDLPWHPEIEDINIQKSSGSSNIELHCKIYNFFPDLLTVIWFDKKKGKNVTDSEKYKISEIRERDANLTFSCNTSLCFEKSLIEEEEVEFICRVEHPCLKNPIQSSTGLLEVTDLQNFIVNNIQGPQSWIFGEKVTLYCAASYCKEDTLVTWILREDNGPTHEVSELLSERDSKHGMLQSADYLALRERTETSDREGLQDITSSLSFTPSISKHKNMVTICRLSCGGKTKEKTFQPKNLYAKPKASDSIKLALLDSGEVLGSFNIQEFYPNDIQITWTGGRQSAYDKLESSEIFTDRDSTHNVLSECKIDGRLFKYPDFTVKVSWKHGSMDVWESRQVSVSDKDYPWRPDIQGIPLPSLINNRPANLMCRISSFFPDNVAVKWLRKEKDSEERFPLTHSEKYKMSDLSLKKQSDNTFECRACLNFTPSVKIEQGAEFVCVVEHPSLTSPIERKTGAIQVTGFPDVKNIINSGDRVFSLNVDGFYPKIITIYWKLVPASSMGDSYTVTSSSSFNENQDGSYTVTSICDLKKNEFCEDNNYSLTATVEHETLEDPINRTISVERQEAKITTLLIQEQNSAKSADLREPSEVDAGPANQPTEDYQKFIMNNIQGPPIWTHGEKVILYCTAYDCSENANVFWIIKENDGTLHEMCDTSTQQSEKPEYVAFRDSTEETHKEGLYDITSSLTLMPSVLKHSGVIIKCRIVCEGKKKEKTFKLQSINAKPAVVEPVTVSLCESGEIMYSLNLQNFYPKEIRIIWTYGPGQYQKPVTSNDVIKINPDLTYSIQSELKVPGDNFKDPNFIVWVSWEHSSLDHPEHRKFCAKDPEFTWRPEIQEIPISPVLLGKRVTLQYNISNYYPDALAVGWFKKEKGSNELVHLRASNNYRIPHRLTHNKQPDNTYSCTASLDVIARSELQGTEFICRVEHPSLEQPIERRTEPLLVKAKPTVSEPVTVSLCESGEIMYSLNLQNFYPKEIKIIWTYEPGQSQKPATSNDVIKPNPDLTYSIQSELKVPGENFKDPNFIVCVSWEHSSLDHPEHRRFCAKDPEFTWRPEMREIPISPVLLGKRVTLQYNISNYYPIALVVRWFKKEEGSQALTPVNSGEKYEIPNLGSARQPDNTYSCTACLGITPSLSSEQGAQFICRVEHPSLEQPIEKWTEPLHVKAKPAVSEPVTVSLCESGEIMYSLNLQNFYPKEIKIIWTYGPGQSQKPVTSNDVIKPNSDLTYSIQSELKVPGDNFKDPNFIVCVSWEHSSLDYPEHRKFCAKDPEFTWRPEIQEIPIPPVLLGQRVTLQYNISNYYPDVLAVGWFKKEKGSRALTPVNSGEKYEIPNLSHDKQPDNMYSCTACLVITPSLSSEQGAQFILRVDYPSLVKPIETWTKPLQVKAKPEMMEPVKLTICDTGDMQCAMNLRHFYPQNLRIRWFWGENLIKSEEKYEKNPDLTFNVLSECRINERDFQNPAYNIRATWEHESMEGCESRDLSIRDPEVFPWRPVMSEIAVPRLKVGERATLKCVISKYFPSALTIEWIKRTRSGHETQCLPPHYTVTDSPSHRLEDHSYSCETCLSFTPSIAAEDGAQFICRVQHPSLGKPLSQSTGVLNVAELKQENARDSPRQKKRKIEEDDGQEIESHSEKKQRSNIEAHLLAAGEQEVDMYEASDGMGDSGEEDPMITD